LYGCPALSELPGLAAAAPASRLFRRAGSATLARTGLASVVTDHHAGADPCRDRDSSFSISDARADPDGESDTERHTERDRNAIADRRTVGDAETSPTADAVPHADARSQLSPLSR
jgi:hypothetical protein